MPGRIYTVQTGFHTVPTAGEDLVALQSSTNRIIRILSAEFSQITDYGDAEAEGCHIRIKRYTAFGSGGGTTNARAHMIGVSTFTGTARVKDTTPGTSSLTVLSSGFNIQAGWFYEPPPDEQVWIPGLLGSPSILAFNLSTNAIADTVSGNLRVTFEVLG